MVNGIMPGYEYDPEHAILLGVDRASEGMVPLDWRKFNRHGFIGGSTGTGKTVTMRNMIEGLSQFGIPTLTVDAKGDLSGMIREGSLTGKLKSRADLLDQYFWESTSLPVAYIAPGGNGYGVPAKINVHSFEVKSLARVLELTPAQTRNLKTAFREGKNDSARPIETLDDLVMLLNGMESDPEKSLTTSMCARIIEAIDNLSEANDGLFGGGPEFDVMDLIRRDDYGWGQVNIIDSSQLTETPEIVTTFLLWTLDTLAKQLPEVGDSELKLVVFFDEAHLLFKGAPKEFIAGVLRTIKTLRSKGVGIFFCSQSDKDVPDDILEQCAARIQHALRVNTHRQRLNLKYTADNFPCSDTYDLEAEVKGMGVGQALVSVLDDDGFATPPALCVMYVPRSRMEPLDDNEIRDYVDAHPLTAKYRRMLKEWAEEKRERKYLPNLNIRPARPSEPSSEPPELEVVPDVPPTLTERLRGLKRGVREHKPYTPHEPGRVGLHDPAQEDADEWATSETV
jgi:hypothetical protein